MQQKALRIRVFLIVSFIVFLLAGCSGQEANAASKAQPEEKRVTTEKDAAEEKRKTLHEFLLPEASGSTVYENDIISIDASNTSEGYIMVRYSGEADKIRLQITVPDGSVYNYTLFAGAYEAFPLSGGNGAYHLDILEHAYDNMYAMAFSQDIEVALNDEFKPFLYPNQYVWFTKDDEAVSYGEKLSDSSSGDLDYVTQVYHYVIDNISYDKELAANVSADYLPDIDVTMKTGKGICFDYASLMAALLRSQGIPTKLVVGYSGDAYHAWISVYLDEIGWVDKIIEFDGKSWSLIDPTLAANNEGSAVKKYIGDGNNYKVKYSY